MSAAPGTPRAPQPRLRFPDGAGGGRAAAGGEPRPGAVPLPLSPAGGPRKRRRTTFSRGRLSELERAFAAVPYPTSPPGSGWAELTQLPEAKIQVWFQNAARRRIRSNQTEPPPLPPLPTARGAGPPSATPRRQHPGSSPALPPPGPHSPRSGVPTSLGSISDLIYSAAITNLGEP
ncbi:LOW QUALITY PROTEIN: homeobox protein SEBOX [Pterocles gutturalis]